MLIFLYGEDDFRSGEKLKEIKNKFLGSADHADLSVLDFSQSSQPEIGGEIFVSGLFSSKKLIIFENLISKGKKESQEKMEKILKEKKNIAENKDITLLFWEEVSPKKNSRLFKIILKMTGIKKQEFKKLKGVLLEKWVKERMVKINPQLSISKEALSKLVSYSGENTFILSNEIEKLINFSAGKEISEETVEKLVKANLSGNIFATIEALGRNDKKTALKLLLEHVEAGDDPFYLLSMFCFQFRNMILVADSQKNNISNEKEMAKNTGLHPYVVKKSLVALQNFSLDKLKKVYTSLSEIDTQSKTGKIDIKLAIQKFIVDL